MAPAGRFSSACGNQARRNRSLVDADARAGHHVAGAVVRNIERNGAVAAVRVIAADIQLQSAGAGGGADHAQCARQVALQRAG